MMPGGVRKADIMGPRSGDPGKNAPLNRNAFVARLANTAATMRRFRSTPPGKRNHAASEKKAPMRPAIRNAHFPILANIVFFPNRLV